MSRTSEYNRVNKHLSVALKYSKNTEFIKTVNVDKYFRDKEIKQRIEEKTCKLSYCCNNEKCELLHGNIADSSPSSFNICAKKYTDSCLNAKCQYNHIIVVYEIVEEEDEEYY